MKQSERIPQMHLIRFSVLSKAVEPIRRMYWRYENRSFFVFPILLFGKHSDLLEYYKMISENTFRRDHEQMRYTDDIRGQRRIGVTELA